MATGVIRLIGLLLEGQACGQLPVCCVVSEAHSATCNAITFLITAVFQDTQGLAQSLGLRPGCEVLVEVGQLVQGGAGVGAELASIGCWVDGHNALQLGSAGCVGGTCDVGKPARAITLQRSSGQASKRPCHSIPFQEHAAAMHQMTRLKRHHERKAAGHSLSW